jgi:hypothetical protein
MYRFLQKSVIGLVVGVLVFSPLVFSLQNNIPVVEVATASAADCTVLKAQFDKGNNPGEVNSYAGIYADDSIESTVTLIVNTENCAKGQELAVEIWEQDGSQGNIPQYSTNNSNNDRVTLDGAAKDKKYVLFVVPDSKNIALSFRVGEENCDTINPECEIYAAFSKVNTDHTAGDQIFTTQDKASQKGRLFYNCREPGGKNEGVCDTFWTYKGAQEVIGPVLTDLWYYKNAQDGQYYKAIGATTKEECTTYSGTRNNGQSTECKQNPPSGSIAEGQVAQVSPDSAMPKCWLGINDGGISVSGCFAQILYYVLYIPTSWLFMIAGMLFDYTFDYSIQSTSYNNAFIAQAWALVRDLCNILFIVIMMYIAISTLISSSAPDWKGMILKVIIVAVLINFSFFFTRVIIDFGNVTARLFYNSDTISITKKVDGKDVVSHGMSETIVSGFDPQRIVLEGKDRLYSDTNQVVQPAEDTSNSTFILITICAVFLNVIGAGIFFKIAILFIGRVIGLWVQIIKSPMAFMSHALPKGWKLADGTSFNSWLTETFKASFMATIFMVFMYMILLFVQVISKSQGQFFNGNMAWILGIVMPFIFIIMMMKMAQETATKWAGEAARELAGKINGVVSAVGGLAVGGAVGLAAGGAAMAGRSTIGKFANGDMGAKLAERLAAAEAKGGMSGKFAKLGLKTFDKAKDASFDIRNNKTFGKGISMVDKNANINVSGGLNSSLIQATPFESRTTGRATQIKEKAENVKKEINRQSKISHVSDSQFKEYHDEQVKRYNDAYQEKLKTKKSTETEEEFKKKYEAKYGKQFEALGKDAKDSDVKAMRKRVEEERREQLLARLDKKGDDFTTLGALANSIRDMKNWTKGETAGAVGLTGAGVAATQGFTGTVLGNTAGVVAGAGMVGAVAGAGLAGVAYAESSQVKTDAYSKAKKDLEKEWKKDDKKAEELEKKVKNDERTLANQIATLNNDASLFVRSVEGLNNAEMKSAVPEIAKIVKDIQESDAYKDIAKEKAKTETERDEKAAAAAAATDDKEKKKLEKELDIINDKIRGFSLEFATVFETELAKKGGDILDITNNLKSKADVLMMNGNETVDQFNKRKKKMLDHVDTLKDVTLGYTQGADRRIRGIDNKDKIESRINKNKESLEGMGKPKDDKKGDDKKK